MSANFSDLGSFVKAFISTQIWSEINISFICQSVYTLRPFAENHCAATLVIENRFLLVLVRAPRWIQSGWDCQLWLAHMAALS
jgi:hypothetical protein